MRAAEAIGAGDSPLTPREADCLELAADGATIEDIARLRGAGIDAFLVGETFMRAADPGMALKQLFFAD